LIMPKGRGRELFEEPLFEDIQILTEEEVGSAAKGESPYKLLTIRGTASRGGVVNKNKRLYPTSVLAKATEKAQAAIKQGRLLGEVDHPEDYGSLGRTAIKFTKLYMQGDDMLFEGEVLATKAGEHLALLLRSGVGVGISTRGNGSVRPIDGPDGTIYEVQPDYELKGIDCVLEASNEFGKVANFESKEGGKRMELTMERLQNDYPELYAKVVESVKEQVKQEIQESLEKDFELKVSQAIEEKKEELLAEARKEVMESEEVVQLKAIVEAVVNAVKPMIPEAKPKEELDAELVKANESLQAQNESLQAQIDTLNAVVETLKEEKAQAEKLLEEQENAKKVAEKIDALVKGHRFEKALRQKLAACKTEGEVQKCFESEEAFIASLVESTSVPTGVGKVKDEDANEEMFSEEIKRQRRLAGLTEGGK